MNLANDIMSVNKMLEGKRPAIKRNVFTINNKMVILKCLDTGATPASLSKTLNINEATIKSIRKSSEAIKKTVQICPAALKCSNIKNPLVIQMESMLSDWIQFQKHTTAIEPNDMAIRHKAIELYVDLEKKSVGLKRGSFVASKGWLERFKKRQNPSNIVYPSELINHAQITSAQSMFPIKSNDEISAAEGYSVEVTIEDDAANNNIDNAVSADVPQRVLDKLSNFFGAANKLIQMASDMDFDLVRMSNFKNGMYTLMLPYKQLYITTVEAVNTAKKNDANDSFFKNFVDGSVPGTTAAVDPVTGKRKRGKGYLQTIPKVATIAGESTSRRTVNFPLLDFDN